MSKNGILFFERSFIPKIFWLKFDVTSALVKNIHHKVIWGITCVSSMTICHLSSGSWQRDLKPIVLPLQQHIKYHFASYLMYITGAKFEWHHSNVSRDSWFCDYYSYLNHLWCHQFNFSAKTWISQKWKVFQKETSILTYFQGPFERANNFYFIE